MVKRLALFLIVLSLSLPVRALAAEPGGTIDGRLVNGTAGGGSVGGETVTLTTYLNGAETSNTTAKSGADGRFVFTGLAADASHSYYAWLRYREADYASEAISFASNETSKSVTLTVYDSSGSDKSVQVSIAHTIIAPVSGGLQVMEFLVFSNTSDKSYIGSGDITADGSRRTVRLPLPQGATDLQYVGNLIQDSSGLFETAAVLPGDNTVIYSYRINDSSGSYSFPRRVDYPTASYNLLVRGENTRVSGTGLTAGGTVNFTGALYNSLFGSDLAAGQTLNIQLAGLSQTGSQPSTGNQQALIWALLVVVVLAAAWGFVYLMKKKSLQPAETTISELISLRRVIVMKKKGVQPAETEGTAEQIKQRLLLEMAKLDDDFEGGKIKKETYAKLRAEKKSRLIALIQDSKPDSRPG